MLLKPESVELLAPVGTWEVLETAISAGADAVYLGGKRFNMRMHRTDVNFDDIMLERAIKYAHKNKAKLYVTVNNLISDHELDKMRDYLKLLDKIGPDALIVQDLSVLELAREIDLSVPLHSSVMLNTHNEYAVKALQEYGITRVVTSREMSLTQLRLLKEKTGIEVEYFIHGDMCIAQSGQCFHSGILFGQSSNRGRCLKPCRWPYQLIDAKTGNLISDNDPGPYKLALKDMCLYRNLPELIQAGVCSFKIEGRMRTADFVKKIVSVYRRAIDRYIADPTGYKTNEQDWRDMYENRSRDFTTCYALGNPGASSIGYTGEREPRFFSQAVQEAGMNTPIALPSSSQIANSKFNSVLAVRVADLNGLTAACENGANIVYVGGEAFKPYKPWTMRDIATAIATAKKHNAEVVVTTPRITMERELGEYEQLLSNIDNLNPHGVMVSNIGMLRLARHTCAQPLQADFSLNVFNHLTTKWLKANGATKATISSEATYNQITDLIAKSALPLEMIIHGPIEAMVSDHCVPSAVLNHDPLTCSDLCSDKRYALLDTAGQRHPIMTDQYCRSHILFAKDLCLLPYLKALTGIAQFRIEGQHYAPEELATITKAYRQELDRIISEGDNYEFDNAQLEKITAISPRDLGIGVFRYRTSR